MNLNQLYYFKTIAKLQHFRLAAQELNVSQPSLSHAMSALEEELGTCLFEKQGRNIALTKYGKVFLSYVEDSLNTLESGTEKIKKLTSDKTGKIDIAYVSPLAPTFIPRLVRNFLNIKENEKIDFTFKQDMTVEIIEGLKSSKYDVAFCSKIDSETDIEFEPILNQELVVIAHHSHPLAAFDSINLQDICPYPLVVYKKDSGLGRLTLKMFKEHGLKTNIIFEGDDEYAISGLVCENFGISVVGKTPHLDHINVKQIKIKNLEYNRYIYLCYVKNRYQSDAIKKFITYVKASNFNI